MSEIKYACRFIFQLLSYYFNFFLLLFVVHVLFSVLIEDFLGRFFILTLLLLVMILLSFFISSSIHLFRAYTHQA